MIFFEFIPQAISLKGIIEVVIVKTSAGVRTVTRDYQGNFHQYFPVGDPVFNKQ